MAWAYWLCNVAPTLYSSLTYDSIYAISLLPTLQYPVQFGIDKKDLSLVEWIFWISKWLRSLQKWENLQNTTGFNPYWQLFCYINIPSWIEFVNFFHPQVRYFGPFITAWQKSYVNIAFVHYLIVVAWHCRGWRQQTMGLGSSWIQRSCLMSREFATSPVSMSWG